MKKLMPFLLIVLLSNYQLSGQNKFNSPAYPGIIEIINPDSSRLNIRLFGDEFFHYVLTIDGYTIKLTEEMMEIYFQEQNVTEHLTIIQIPTPLPIIQ